MNSVLQKRVQKLERIRNPPMTIEDLLSWCDDEKRLPIHYVRGQNPMLDFLQGLSDKLKNAATTSD